MHVIKYQFIKDELLKEINSGKVKPGQKFYSESELKNRYDVSSATVIKAIQELVSEGLLVRYQGKGTFISKGKRNEKVILTETDGLQKGTEKISLLSSSLENEIEILKKLQLPHSEKYYKFIRSRSNNKKIFLIQISYIAQKFVKDELIFQNDKFQSIYATLNKINNFDMYSLPFTQSIDIINDIPECYQKHLKIQKGSPVVLMTRYTFDKEMNVIEYVETYKTTETFHIEIRNTEENINE